MEQTTENTQNFNAVSNSGTDDGTSEGVDGGGMHRMGKGGQYFNCHQHGHAWRHCPKMSEQDMIAFAAKKGVNYKGAPKGGGKDQDAKWSVNGGKGWDYGKGLGNQWGKGWQFSGNRPHGEGLRKKGLNEIGSNGWGSDDVWDMDRFHLLTARPALAQKHNQTDCLSCGRSGEPPGGRPLETDSDAEQNQRVPGDGRGRGELGVQRQQHAKPAPFDA